MNEIAIKIIRADEWACSLNKNSFCLYVCMCVRCNEIEQKPILGQKTKMEEKRKIES